MNVEIDSIYSMLLIFVRAGALFMAIPALGGQTVPLQIRLALGLLAAVILVPVVPAAHLLGQHALWLILAVLFELLVGLLMGFAIQAVFATVEFAAQTISTEIGLASASSLNPLSESGNGTSLGTLLFFFSLLVFFATGLHHDSIAALARSYQALPAGSLHTGGFSLNALVEVSAQIFVMGVLMAAPFIAVNFLINATFALLGKMAPKMNVFMTSFAVRILAGLAALVSVSSLLAHYLNVQFERVPLRMFQLILGG